ncbi:MAG: M15 family metallopeptidase [Bradymonadia bacterium]
MNSIHEKIQKHWPSIQKIWPNHDYSQHTLILYKLSPEGESIEAWALSVDGKNKLSKEQQESISPPQAGGYASTKFAGKDAIVMSAELSTNDLEKDADELYRTATHELVHFYHQQEVEDYKLESNRRAESYPISAKARLYRQMLYRRLISAYENPEKEQAFLGAAKYWLEKWGAEFPKERSEILLTDIVEGTAKYIENLATFSTLDTSSDAFRADAIKNILKEEIFISADSESYELGYIAGILLDKKIPDWKVNFYPKQIDPVTLLLSDVKAVEDAADIDFESKLVAEIDAVNEDLKATVHDLVIAYDALNIPYLKLDISNVSYSATMENILQYKDLDILSNYANKYNIGGKLLEINGHSVFSEELDDGRRIIIIPLTMPYTIDNNILNIHTQSLLVDGIEVKTGKDKNQRVLYMIELYSEPSVAKNTHTPELEALNESQATTNDAQNDRTPEQAMTQASLPGVERKAPTRCSYSSYYWSSTLRRAVDHYQVDKAYSEVTDDERSPDDPRCTPCVEDQVTIDPREFGIEHNAFRVCYIYADALKDALREIKESGSFDIVTLTGYRVGKTRGKVVDGKRTEWSNHSFGTAIDINAKYNGLYKQCHTTPREHSSELANCQLSMGGEWAPEKRPKLSITQNGIVVKVMTKFWKWGGSIPGELKDIMHFSITGY